MQVSNLDDFTLLKTETGMAVMLLNVERCSQKVSCITENYTITWHCNTC